MAFYVSSELSFQTISELNLMAESIESLFIKIEIQNHSVIVGNIYRPPRGNIEIFTAKICSLLEVCRSNYGLCPVYILGDFNLDVIDQSCSTTKNFVDSLLSFNLVPVIKRPTRVTLTSATLLDQIWTNDNRVRMSGIIRDRITDHFSVFSTTGLKKESSRDAVHNKYYRCYNSHYRTLLKNKLSEIS